MVSKPYLCTVIFSLKDAEKSGKHSSLPGIWLMTPHVSEKSVVGDLFRLFLTIVSWYWVSGTQGSRSWGNGGAWFLKTRTELFLRSRVCIFIAALWWNWLRVSESQNQEQELRFIKLTFGINSDCQLEAWTPVSISGHLFFMLQRQEDLKFRSVFSKSQDPVWKQQLILHFNI